MSVVGNQPDDVHHDGDNASKEALLLAACHEGNSQSARELVEQGAEIFVTDEVGRTALHFAAASGDVDTIKFVLESGIPWNTLDVGNYTAGDYAENGGHTDAYTELVQAGIRAEMVLRMLNQESKINKAANEDYLSQPVEYSGDKLIDAEKNGVMMSWEAPLMELHAQIIGSKPDSVVLNVGFGMGIIDSALQDLNPALHVIVEAHPDVYQHMKDQGWDKKPNVRILFGRWQDKMDEIRQLGPYDGIFFDTFGEFYKDLDDFHQAVFSASDDKEPLLCRPNGIYSFFNGLGGDHKLFHDVYCHIVQADLLNLGIITEYSQVSSDIVMDEETWKGVKRPYWMIKSYNLPTICFESLFKNTVSQPESGSVASDWQGRPSVLQCGHVFHQSCISVWLKGKRHGNCPTCRRECDGEPISLYFEAEPAAEGSEDPEIVDEPLQDPSKEVTNAQIRHRNKIIKTLCKNIAAAQDEAKKAHEKVANGSAQVNELKMDLAQEKVRNVDITAKLSTYKKGILDYKTELMRLKKSVAEKSRECEVKCQRISNLEAELAEQQRVVTSMGDVRSTNEQLARSLKRERAKLETQMTINTCLGSRVTELEKEKGWLRSTTSQEPSGSTQPPQLPALSSMSNMVSEVSIVDLVSEASIETDLDEDINELDSSIVQLADKRRIAKPHRRPGPTFGMPLKELESPEALRRDSHIVDSNSQNPFAVADMPFASLVSKDPVFTPGFTPSNPPSYRSRRPNGMPRLPRHTGAPNGLGGSRQSSASCKKGAAAIQSTIPWGSKK
ncbi:hypothetical protein J3B01_002485 [Coemansia erecta]|nr:hypothetical protein J3B01_002485 [Coemansia erecta]